MDWNAVGSIGEVLGSFGVLISIVYFGRQLRRSETAMQSSTISAMQVARLHVNDQRLEHAEILLKANAGEDLTQLERSRLLLLFAGEYQTMFFIYMNQRRLGDDGAVQARNFARFVCDNPGIKRLWHPERIQFDFTDVPNPDQDSWLEAVSHHINALKKLRDNDQRR